MIFFSPVEFCDRFYRGVNGPFSSKLLFQSLDKIVRFCLLLSIERKDGRSILSLLLSKRVIQAGPFLQYILESQLVGIIFDDEGFGIVLNVLVGRIWCETSCILCMWG